MKTSAIPGDGIGTEVVSVGIEVLRVLARREGSFQFKIDHFDWGGEYYKKHGRMMPESLAAQIGSVEAVVHRCHPQRQRLRVRPWPRRRGRRRSSR